MVVGYKKKSIVFRCPGRELEKQCFFVLANLRKQLFYDFIKVDLLEKHFARPFVDHAEERWA